MMFATVVVVALLAALPAPATLLPEHTGFGDQLDQLGFSVSIDGDRALVGAPGDEGSSVFGTAYVFRRLQDDWVLESRLAPNGVVGEEFGSAVSLDGDRALIGAPDPVSVSERRGAAFVFEFDGQDWAQVQVLQASDGADFDDFGTAVSLQGQRAVIGAPRHDQPADGAGAVYVFEQSAGSFLETAKLTAEDAAVGALFGVSVSLSGDRVLVGAVLDDAGAQDSGAAYVFEYDGAVWRQDQKLVAGDGEASDFFGIAVGLEGDTAAVGAWSNDSVGEDSGAVYVFNKAGGAWSQSQKLIASDAVSGEAFGFSLGLTGNRLIVGAVTETTGSDFEGGAAYVLAFDGQQWVHESKLRANDSDDFDNFGAAVDVDGDLALIGALSDESTGFSQGSAYVFAFSDRWRQDQKLDVGDGVAGDRFGAAISLDGSRALVGAPWGNDTGLAYVFDFVGGRWQQSQRLTPSDGMLGNRFGFAVSLSGNRALVGAYRETSGGNEAGAAYVFEFDGSRWRQTAKLTASDGAAGYRFGYSLSLRGNRALIGAYGNFATQAGAAYVYELDGGWVQTAILTASNPDRRHQFGYSVSLGDDRALIGDRQVDASTGAAYVFDFASGAWAESVILSADDGESGDLFGHAVSLDGDRALIGAWFDDTVAAGRAGSAYVFERDASGWQQAQRLFAADGVIDQGFGQAVALAGDVAVVGAVSSDSNSSAGSAYLYARDNSGWNLLRKVLLGDATVSNGFGESVTVAQDIIGVGAQFDGSAAVGAGSARLYLAFPPLFADGFEDAPITRILGSE